MTNLLTYILILLFTFTSSVNACYTYRGDTGAGIFGLKNYGNENTNTMSGKEWLESHAGDDTIREGSLGLISDLHNTMTGDGRGDGFILTGLAIAASIYSIQDSARKIYAWFDGEGNKGKTTYADPINGEIYTAEGNIKEGATDLGAVVKGVGKVASKVVNNVKSTQKGLGGNPFTGKTLQQAEEMVKKHGGILKGSDPINGKGSYIYQNGSNQTKYYFDKGENYKKGYESPHVDVIRNGNEATKHRLFFNGDIK